MVVRSDEHVAALHQVVMADVPDRAACRRKDRRPPSAAAQAEADRIRATHTRHDTDAVVVDFAAYAAATRPLGRDATGGAR
jgi:hypothetical protein